MDIVLLIIALSISTYVVSSIYYRFRKQDILPNLVVLCYLWQIIGVVAAYVFYYKELYQLLNDPIWLNFFFLVIMLISTGSFIKFLIKQGLSMRTVYKSVLLTGCVIAILYGEHHHYYPFSYAIFFNIAIYTVATLIMYVYRDKRQSGLCYAQLSVAIIVLTVAYTMKGSFDQTYILGISNGAIFLIALAAMLYYLEYTTLSLRDSNELLQKEKELSDGLKWKYDQALGVTHEGIWEYDLSAGQIFISKSLQEKIQSNSPYLEKPYEAILKLLHPEDVVRISKRVGECQADFDSYCMEIEDEVRVTELRIWDGNKEQYTWIKLKITSAKDPLTGLCKFYGTVSDIQNVKDAEAKTYYLAYFDPLTELRNQTSFIEWVGKLKKSYALFLIDLDRFKYVNDTRGHTFGDAVLKAVAARLVELIHDKGEIFRYEGTAYVMAVPESAFEQISSALHMCFEQPFSIGESKIHLTASIGHCKGNPAVIGFERTIMQLDLAKNHAKERGGDCQVAYEEAFYEELQHKVEISDALRQAIQRNELFFHYQPQIEMATGRTLGYEALLRWKKDDAFVPPDKIIAIAEETGQIYALGHKIIETIFSESGFVEAHQSISINLSAMQLEQSEFLSDLMTLVQKTGVEPGKFIFEITESVLLQGIEGAKQVLNELREIGFKISLDDFGSGYASYSYLMHLPLDELKLDKGLVQSCMAEQRNAEVVRHMIQIGKSLGYKVVCEGIETEAMHQLLTLYACDIGQGYYYSRPMALEQMLNLEK